MRNTANPYGSPGLQQVELHSTDSAVQVPDQYDMHASYQTLDDDLAEHPQAYAAHLNYRQNQWN